jgi:dienelactone hydrolase
MLLIIEVAFGILLGWLFIEGVKRLKRLLPSERMTRAKATIDGLIADAVEKGDIRMLEFYEAESHKWDDDPHAYKPDFEKAKREAGKKRQLC